jgi:hypothetical protein
MVIKRVLCPERLRRVPKQFSWVDHRLVRDKRLCGVSHSSLALYLFLVTVGDEEGLSYYSDAAVLRYLSMQQRQLAAVRQELCERGLIAYSHPLYQVLGLSCGGTPLPAALCERQQPRSHHHTGEAASIGAVLRQVLGGGR